MGIVIDTRDMHDDEFVAMLPAEACTEVGWSDDEQSSMDMLAYVMVYAMSLLAILSAASVLL